MHRALTEVFSNERGPDKLVVILDASSAYHLQAARHVTTFKETAVCLNKVSYRAHPLVIFATSLVR